jgi:hypothetical protein
MSLLRRKPSVLGRAERALRDDRAFVVATEDTYAPAQYFDGIREPRVIIKVLGSDDTLSAPEHVVSRLKDARQAALNAGDLLKGDEFWVLLDTDHWVKANHIASLQQALLEARQAGFLIAMSNPCFELWLLLHHEDVPPGTVFGRCAEVGKKLRARLGRYNKCGVCAEDFPASTIDDAIRRARALESNPDSPAGYWPEKAGTRVYLLVEAIRGKTAVPA